MKDFILFTVLALVGCAAHGEDAKPVRETYTNALLRVDASIKGLSHDLGNNTGELNAVKEELKALKSEVAEVAGEVAEVRKLLSVDTEISIEVPKAADPPQLSDSDSSTKLDAPPAEAADRRILFQGKPIDVNAWLRRSVVTVEINGDVDKHLRDHGLDGDFSRFSRAQKVHLHSVAHTYGIPLKSAAPRKVVVRAPTVVLPQASNCANGNCARQWAWSSRPRLFGRR